MIAWCTTRSAKQGRPIALIADEPYRQIVYDGVEVPWPVQHYPHTVHVTSFSKDLALPGERIGYVAFNPASEDAEPLWRAMVFGMRALGFVNAPAIQQRLIAELLDVRVDMTGYTEPKAKFVRQPGPGFKGNRQQQFEGSFRVFHGERDAVVTVVEGHPGHPAAKVHVGGDGCDPVDQGRHDGRVVGSGAFDHDQLQVGDVAIGGRGDGRRGGVAVLVAGAELCVGRSQGRDLGCRERSVSHRQLIDTTGEWIGG